MKKVITYILALIILILIFINLKFFNSKEIFDDIMILGLWQGSLSEKQYEISKQNTVEIDVFTTINNKMYKKIAPGTKGSFVIKFKRKPDLNYQIKITEKSPKPQNLEFIIDNKKYTSINQIKEILNEKFINTEKVTVYWEWKYYIDDTHDVQDTIDGQSAQNYIFEIEAIVEEKERTEYEN